MRKPILLGIAGGAVLAMAGVAAVDTASERADAQSSQFEVSAEQLKINQNISSAAVRRSNRSLNYLAPIRTTTSDNADDGSNGVIALSAIEGSGDGWTSSQIAGNAITNEKIEDGAVTSSKLDSGTQAGIAYFARVSNGGALQGNRGFENAGRPAVGTYILNTSNEVSTQQCAVNTTVNDNGADGGFYAKYAITGDSQITVRTYNESGDRDNEPFSITLFCTS